jgi:hypothetical protein
MALDLTDSDHELLDEFLHYTIRAHHFRKISKEIAVGDIAEAFTFICKDDPGVFSYMRAMIEKRERELRSSLSPHNFFVVASDASTAAEDLHVACGDGDRLTGSARMHRQVGRDRAGASLASMRPETFSRDDASAPADRANRTKCRGHERRRLQDRGRRHAPYR